jgi:hypothetical protein
MSSTAGYKFLSELKDFADSSPAWEAQDYWNLSSWNAGKINLHHESGWDFFLTRAFASDHDEFLYMQPLSTVYSNYGIFGTTQTALLADEEIACTFVSRPVLEHGVFQEIGDSEIYYVAGNTTVTWCSQVDVDNSRGFGVSALGSFGFIGEYRYVGGLPYSASNLRPSLLEDHFFTSDGSIRAINSEGATFVFKAKSLDEIINANPLIDSQVTFQLFQIPIFDSEIYAGFLPDLLSLSAYRITLEATDGLTLYLPSETSGKAFQDGNRVDRWVVLQNPVRI